MRLRRPHIRIELLHTLIRRRLLISLPLAAAALLFISAFSPSSTQLQVTEHASSPQTTILRHKSQPGQQVLGDQTKDNSANSTHVTSDATTVTTNETGTTVTGGSTVVSDETQPSPAPTPPPSDPCDVCERQNPTTDSMRACIQNDCYSQPPGNNCNPCSSTRTNPSTMCPMYYCTTL